MACQCNCATSVINVWLLIDTADRTALHSANGWEPKANCKRHPRVSEGSEMTQDHLIWTWPSRLFSSWRENWIHSSNWRRGVKLKRRSIALHWILFLNPQRWCTEAAIQKLWQIFMSLSKYCDFVTVHRTIAAWCVSGVVSCTCQCNLLCWSVRKQAIPVKAYKN